MLYNESKTLTLRIVCALFLVLIAGSLIAFRQFFLVPQIQESKDAIAQVVDTARKIDTMSAELEQYEEKLEKSIYTYTDLEKNKSSFVDTLNGLAQKNSLKVNKLIVGDSTQMGSLQSLVVDLELDGSIYNIRDYVQNLYDTGIVSRITSISYRTKYPDNVSVGWLWRSIDDATALPWFSLEDEGNYETNNNDEHVISAADLMGYEYALCYLRLEFIGTRG